jgi:hypothetical protein
MSESNDAREDVQTETKMRVHGASGTQYRVLLVLSPYMPLVFGMVNDSLGERMVLEAGHLLYHLSDDTEAAVRSFLAPVPCGTCGGSPHPSGIICVCEGVGTQDAEVEGLRQALFDAQVRLGMYPPLQEPSE